MSHDPAATIDVLSDLSLPPEAVRTARATHASGETVRVDGGMHRGL